MADPLTEKYEFERLKRQNASKGLAQYLHRHKQPAFTLEDPWIASGTPIRRPVEDGGHVKIAIFGAGFGGLLAAAECLRTGVAKSPQDILLIDRAGGFGGTWYWNRYPGAMCDVESYVYLPLLEETGYIPTRRYAGGNEIRKYLEILAKHYKVDDRAMFQSLGKSLVWTSDRWKCEILNVPKGLQQETTTVYADYVIIGAGDFTYPKVPDVPGVDTFKGSQIHTARWNYEVTGGSDMEPILDRLSKKRVAIIGTGATAIQTVPELAKYAQELYVVQRTPSAVDFRHNRDTDKEEWSMKIANKEGWQKERAANLQIFTEQDHDLPVKLTDDGFSAMPTIAGAFGGPSDLKAEDIAKRMEMMRVADDIRSNRVRARTEEIVTNQETAKKLQAWYPGWCKRPTFHDEYLPAFNRPNVHLIDTDGQSITKVTEGGIVVNGQEVPVDVIVWSTGYGNPLIETPAGKAEMAVIGKTGQDMEELNKIQAFETLHGVMALEFPNMFLCNMIQAGVGANQVQRLWRQAEHIAYTISTAEQRTGDKKAVIEPTSEACERWGDEIASAAHLTSGMRACTPGYFTAEGDAASFPPELLTKLSRTGIYGSGYLKYARILDAWETEGKLSGLVVSAA